jgi:hypothetical protein
VDRADYDVPPIDAHQLSEMFLGIACLAASHAVKPLRLTATMRVISIALLIAAALQRFLANSSLAELS